MALAETEGTVDLGTDANRHGVELIGKIDSQGKSGVRSGIWLSLRHTDSLVSRATPRS